VVEEESDAAAFRDYVPPSAAAEEQPAPPVEVAAPPPPPPPPVQAPQVFIALEIPPPEIETSAAAITEEAPALMEIPTMSPAWGATAGSLSPLAGALAKSQRAYVELYGSTGQTPL